MGKILFSLRDLSLIQFEIMPEEVLDALYIWENEWTIRHLHHVLKSREEYETFLITRDEIALRMLAVASNHLILFEGKNPIGFLSIAVDPDHLYKTIANTCWPGIVIGETAARGKGYGKQTMQWLEEHALNIGCNRIELGVFEHNLPAQRLYQSIGYDRIGSIPEFTWHDGMMHSDIRMEKWLSVPRG